MGRWRAIWGSFRRDEQLVLMISLIIAIGCGGIALSRSRRVEPPVFQDAPGAPPSQVVSLSLASGSTARQKSSGGSDQPSATPTEAVKILVHVTGAVRHPGLQWLPAGARVNDAIERAGGVLPDNNEQALNLAAHVQDGEQIVVPSRGQNAGAAAAPVVAADASGETEAPNPSPPAKTVAPRAATPPVESSSTTTASRTSGRKPMPSAPVNVNTATADQLNSLPGIGPAMAGRIMEYRRVHGLFHSSDDLDQVKGIGPKKLDKIKPFVRF